MTIPLHHRGTEKVTTENDRLDEQMERMISNVRDFAVEHGKPNAVAVKDCPGCQRQANALRSRIRQLVNEAKVKRLVRSLEESLNSGDGSYKP